LHGLANAIGTIAKTPCSTPRPGPPS
jgi:hypothetical protein